MMPEAFAYPTFIHRLDSKGALRSQNGHTFCLQINSSWKFLYLERISLDLIGIQMDGNVKMPTKGWLIKTGRNRCCPWDGMMHQYTVKRIMITKRSTRQRLEIVLMPWWALWPQNWTFPVAESWFIALWIHWCPKWIIIPSIFFPPYLAHHQQVCNTSKLQISTVHHNQPCLIVFLQN